MSPDYKDPRPIPLAYVYMLGQFRSPRTGRLYSSASPRVRYQRRYMTNGTVMPREKLKLRDKPGARRERERGKRAHLELDQCATRNTATRERCGEIVHAHPCGGYCRALWSIPLSSMVPRPTRNTGSQNACCKKLKLQNITVQIRYGTASILQFAWLRCLATS